MLREHRPRDLVQLVLRDDWLQLARIGLFWRMFFRLGHVSGLARARGRFRASASSRCCSSRSRCTAQTSSWLNIQWFVYCLRFTKSSDGRRAEHQPRCYGAGALLQYHFFVSCRYVSLRRSNPRTIVRIWREVSKCRMLFLPANSSMYLCMCFPLM